ncbi:hypothetical protein C3747_18g343 [Trypanosoma cruzi]|uniref:Chromosome partition protein Smc n=2 Tax=Trypanosoma cruzi TaxID=5693 RepID=Q4CW15_TRYCC|nr:hypothetical protein, conserved [Trypanosoma cruzi]EAN84464.1 hypothetical protein, conserved [Trypanosoma cruzi]PWV17375.1 hypothetical protein C3747_18g343 [Trypanosoma cruzi]RNC47625.1 hypothetical protein TcCL_NonESM02540 [Trypanosoma cruzi]|eukprot:XP_806315.1 hypothetical protein [Trypanosoma cruzi strain CL Brener]
MEDGIEFLESLPLMGFQMDGSHLHNVLKRVIQEQQKQAQFQRQMSLRLSDMEDDLRSMNTRQKELEKALGNFGPDALRKMRQQIEYLDEGLESVARDVKEARQLADEAARVVEDASREIQSVGRGLGTVQDRQDRLQQELDDTAGEIEKQNRQLGEAMRTVEREQAEQIQQVQNLFRDFEHKNGPGNLEKVREMLEELSERTDKNFRSVEESARAVDAELNRHRSDLNGLQANIGSLDEKVRQYLSNIARDVDAKCQMILSTLREHERSSLEIEEHMVAAGQALARKKGLKEARRSDSIGTRRNVW